MSDKNNTSNLGDRIQGLSSRIEAQAKAKALKQRVILAAGVVLILMSGFVLTRLTVQGRDLDAEAMTMIGRNEIEKRLPGAREKLQWHLKSQAPQIVGEAYQALVDMLPGLRVYLMKDLNARIDELNASFENNLSKLLADRIQASKERIDSQYPELSDREKVERLITDVSNEFNRQYAAAVETLYVDYSKEMSRVSQNIVELRGSRPGEMSDEERIKREIIETMVQIMRREKLLDH